MSGFIGPPLPPGLNPARDVEEDDNNVAIPPRALSGDSFGPQLSHDVSIAQVRRQVDHEHDEEDDSQDREVGSKSATSATPCYGPTLPSKPLPKTSNDDDLEVSSISRYGPSLPPGFETKGSERAAQLSVDSTAIGPSLLAGVGTTEATEEEEEEEVIGPMPVVGEVNETESRKREFESRAKAMKNKLLGKVHTYMYREGPNDPIRLCT